MRDEIIEMFKFIGMSDEQARVSKEKLQQLKSDLMEFYHGDESIVNNIMGEAYSLITMN